MSQLIEALPMLEQAPKLAASDDRRDVELASIKAGQAIKGRAALRVIDCNVTSEDRFWQAVSDFVENFCDDQSAPNHGSPMAASVATTAPQNAEDEAISMLPRQIDALGALTATIDWTWVADREFRFSYVSEAGQRLFGDDQAWTRGGTIWQAAWCRDPEETMASLLSIARAGRPFREHHIDFRRPDGAVGTISISGSPCFDLGRNLVGYAGFAVTVPGAAQLSAPAIDVDMFAEGTTTAGATVPYRTVGRDLEAFKALLEYSNDFLAVVRQDGIVTLACISSPREIGLDAEGVIARSFADLIHPDDRAECKRLFDIVRGADGTVARGRLRVKSADGSWRTFACLFRDATDVRGIGGIVVSACDITNFIGGGEAPIA